MTYNTSLETSDNLKTTIVVYAHREDDKNLFLLFKQGLSQKVNNKQLKEQWEVLHEEVASCTEDAHLWLANYLGVPNYEIDLQRVKYIQEEKSIMGRVLVFKADDDVLNDITALNPNSKWVSIGEIPKLLSIGHITQQLSNLIANIQTWRLDLNNLNQLKYEPAGAPYPVTSGLLSSYYY